MCHRIWGGSRAPRAKHPRELGEKLPPPPASCPWDRLPRAAFETGRASPPAVSRTPAGCGGSCQLGKPMALGMGLLFIIQMRDARGLEGTAEVSKAPPLSPCPLPLGTSPLCRQHAAPGPVLLPWAGSGEGAKSPWLQERGSSKGKLTGTAHVPCPLWGQEAPLRWMSAWLASPHPRTPSRTSPLQTETSAGAASGCQSQGTPPSQAHPRVLS